MNLIPYNQVEGLPWERPAEEVCEAFLARLEKQKVTATLRREKGGDIDAACGQLRLKTERELARTAVAAFGRKPDSSAFSKICGALPRRRYDPSADPSESNVNSSQPYIYCRALRKPKGIDWSCHGSIMTPKSE